MKTVTHRQKEVLDFIRSRADANQMPPTLREIAEHFGWSSPSAAQEHVTALRRKGMLEPRKRAARSLRLIGPARKRLMSIPVISDAAGNPETPHSGEVIFIETGAETVPTPPRHFALRMSNDAMKAKHILTGDIVILERQIPPQPGEVVAGLVDGKYTLSTYTPESTLPVHGVFRMLVRPSN
ncbi:MAG: transcriptional repressor LexA [Verrucomicrobiota bacterium]